MCSASPADLPQTAAPPTPSCPASLWWRSCHPLLLSLLFLSSSSCSHETKCILEWSGIRSKCPSEEPGHGPARRRRLRYFRPPQSATQQPVFTEHQVHSQHCSGGWQFGVSQTRPVPVLWELLCGEEEAESELVCRARTEAVRVSDSG